MKTKLHTFDKLVLSIDMLSISLSDKVKCQLRFQRITYKMNENEWKRLLSCCYYIRFRDHMGIRRRSNPLLEPISNESAAMGSPLRIWHFPYPFLVDKNESVLYRRDIIVSFLRSSMCTSFAHTYIHTQKHAHTHTHIYSYHYGWSQNANFCRFIFVAFFLPRFTHPFSIIGISYILRNLHIHFDDYCFFFSNDMSITKAQSNEGRSRMQSISNLYLSPPIACPSFPVTIFWRNLYISIRILSRARPWYT